MKQISKNTCFFASLFLGVKNRAVKTIATDQVTGWYVLFNPVWSL